MRRYMVAYIATDGGVDALRFGIAAAAGAAEKPEATLDIVMAMSDHGVTPGEYPRDSGYDSIIENQVGEWLDDARAEVPAYIPVTTRVAIGENIVDTLLEQAQQLGASMIVVGSQGGGIFKRLSLGTVVNQLIERSPIPVAVVPRGYNEAGPLTRFTLFSGQLPNGNPRGLDVREGVEGTSIGEWQKGDVAVIERPGSGLAGKLRAIPVPTIISPT